MSIIKRITSAGLSLAMAATVIPSSFAVSTKSASTLSSVTAKYLDAENGKEIAEKQTYSVTHEEKSPQTIINYTYTDYTESVEYIYSHKDLTYIIGYPDKGVHPNGDLTRAEAAMIFYRLYDGDYPSFTRRMSNGTFKDVSAKNWFYEPVETLYNIGLLEGKSKDTFAPNAPISRAEFAALAARFQNLKYTSGKVFSDVEKGHWAYSYINAASEAGWIQGYPDGTFRPDKEITRTETVTLVNSMINRTVTREKLKELNVGVFFELQNINTLSGEGELMLTILAAFAQAESESGSAGAKMVYQRKYEAGIPVQYLERSFGYTKDERGVFVADEAEAVWVRKIYEMAADGYTPASIKRYLNENGVKTVGGVQWVDSTVFRLLENEIYKGDYIMHKHFVNEERKLVRNRGEVDAWYIEDDHEAIVSPELWQKAQDALAAKRDYLAEGSVIEEFTEENYPYMNKIYCAKCGYPLYKRIYSKGNRLNWGCSGTKRYGKSFCDGINIPDGVLRSAWHFEENTYIDEKASDKGVKEFTYLKERSWKRRHKKKQPSAIPENTETEYPYREKIFCALCGSRLVRYVNPQNHKVTWVCNRRKRKGKEACDGTRVPDTVIKGWGEIKNDIYIQRKDDKNGKKRYSYTSKKPSGIRV